MNIQCERQILNLIKKNPVDYKFYELMIEDLEKTNCSKLMITRSAKSKRYELRIYIDTGDMKQVMYLHKTFKTVSQLISKIYGFIMEYKSGSNMTNKSKGE